MFYVSEIFKTKPNEYKSELQQSVYNLLEKLQLPFERVDTDEAITMADCVLINECLNMKMVKTLFLCNRQQTQFYLFITTGEKPFRSKEFSTALNISRVSFAPAEQMLKMLGTKVGATTIFSILLDDAKDVQIIIDKDIVNETYYGCSDGTTTGYLKLKTDYILNTILPYKKHNFTIVEV